MSSSMGLDASLALLRHELEGMQQQDKTLYTQLLTLRESIRGLKTELRKEREECEETFKNLEESSGQQLEDDEVFLENETEEVFKTQDEWKHDRQDSGISVKTPEGETQDVTSKHLTQDDSSSLAPKPGIISHSKHDLEPQEKTRDVETTQKTTAVQSKPVLIQHSKQDSGILIDEEAVRETKLLSRLVESSEMFQKLENRKFDRIIQDRWQKARENPLGSRNEVHERPLVNRGSMYQHQRSRSSNDLLSRPEHQRTLPQQLSVGSLRPRHSHTHSCPQTLTGKEFQTVEKQPLKQFFELDINEKLEKSQVEKTEGSQRKELQNRTELQSVIKPSFQHFTELHRDLNEKLEKSRVENLETNEGSTQRPPAPSTPTSPGQGAPSPVPLLTPRHSHTRSLPVSSMRGFIMPEKQLSRKENRRSMENISDHKVVPAHHVRPRQRSASVVDLGSNDVIESRGSPRQNSVIPHKTSVVHVDSLNQYKDVAQNKAVYINNIKQENNLTQVETKAAKPLRAVLVSACEVNVSNITDRQTLSRRPSLDEKTRNCRPSDVTRRLTLTRTDRISPRPGLLYQNTPRSPRFLSPQSSRNHLRHHTMPEYDVMRRRHSFIWHAPSKSWDGYARKPKDGRGLTRSVSQVSFV